MWSCSQIVVPSTRDILDVVDGMSNRGLKKWIQDQDSRSGVYDVAYSFISECRQLESTKICSGEEGQGGRAAGERIAFRGGRYLAYE